MNLEDTMRREFIVRSIKLSGCLAISKLLLGCAHNPYEQGPKEFTLENFDRWYKSNRLYTDNNPNLISPHFPGPFPTFKRSTLSGRVTPGMDFHVPYGEKMVSIAPGIVSRVRELNTGRAGGKIVKVLHTDYKGVKWHFQAYYAHLHRSFVEVGQNVKRGEPIGNVTIYRDRAKLVLKQQGNLVNADNYGVNNGYMNYEADIDAAVLERTDREKHQDLVYYELREHFNHPSKYKPRYHNRTKGKWACQWSMVEHFRYLSELFKLRPDYFPKLTDKRFNELKINFIKFQPYVLTLPWSKGGNKHR